LFKNGIFFPLAELVHASTSQIYPLGQQWTPSLQHLAFGIGQQPYTPGTVVLQQVFPLGHSLVPSGQITFFRHVPCSLSQVFPSGQQVVWSLQHTPLGWGQHEYVPFNDRQQVSPSSQMLFPSGQSTLVSSSRKGMVAIVEIFRIQVLVEVSHW